jgi:GNAT superfamily N-acetyltransferase
MRSWPKGRTARCSSTTSTSSRPGAVSAGRRALDALEAEARRHGVTEIGLSVFNHNTAARALYRACGFVPITTTLLKPVVQE